MLELSDVRLRGRERAAVSFEHVFADGEIAVVLGANQAGKTDLCRLIAGLATRAHGQVRLDGVDISAHGPRQRPVGLVYQAFVNYPNLTVAQNIASPLRARGAESVTITRKVAELAAKLRIENLLDRLPDALSGGQQQRLAIARALAKDARVLLLDEPLVNLDFKLREALEIELRELLEEANTVVIYTSSDPRDAFTLGDQVLLLADGEKVQTGKPIDVYRTPSSITAMELLSDPAVNRFSQAEQLCAVRPEHLLIGEQARACLEEVLNFDMVVSAYETNGDESFVHGLVESQEWVLRGRGMLQVHPGQLLQVAVRAADVMRF